MLHQAVNLPERKNIVVAAQTCHAAESGAFTGECSIPMLIDIGVRDVIIGHSERRQYYNETNETVAAKVAAALELQVRPIICVGETLEDRENGRTEEVLAEQLNAVLAKVPDLGSSVIAYEPVWAIGTGKTASDSDANNAHQFIRGLISEKHGAAAAERAQILYGGSVKPGNIAGLIAQPHIDGALIGGASLAPADFAAIVNSVVGN
jgi:triosephosphate isomerase